MRRNVLVITMIFFLLGHISSKVVPANHMAQVKCLGLGLGFLTGSTKLIVLKVDGRFVSEEIISAEITRDNGSLWVSWRGNLPSGLLFLERTREITAPPHARGDSEVIDLPNVPRRERPKTEKVVAVIFVGTAQQIQERQKKNKVYPRVAALWPGVMRVPREFKNDVLGWNFPKEYLLENKGKLLTMDIDFGDYCSRRCDFCFRRDSRADRGHDYTLSYENTVSIIRQAMPLGLEAIKILGAGEPFEDSDFLRFLYEMQELNIKVAIFTKGHVLGDDKLAHRQYFHRRDFQRYGVKTAEDLVARIAAMENVSILLSFQSFDPAVQDGIVHVPGHTKQRNRALELMTAAGMNKCQPTRIALCTNPVMHANLDELFEINQWSRERNLYCLVTPSMCAGMALTGEEPLWKLITPSSYKLIKLYTEINIYNIEKGVLTFEEFLENGVSPYAGAVPCHQVACGMYVTNRGVVLRCPGDDITFFGNTRTESLADIWSRCENRKRGLAGMFNCHCPPKDGKTIPLELYEKVRSGVEVYWKLYR